MPNFNTLWLSSSGYSNFPGKTFQKNCRGHGKIAAYTNPVYPRYKMAANIADTFDLAIQAEVRAEEIYHIFARRFAHEPEVARWWEHYATEEREHAYWLGKIRKSVPAEKLAEAADPEIYRDAQHTLKLLIAVDPQAVTNLEEAYQIANEAESSEVNTVFRFLVENFSSEPQTRHLLTQHLRHHIDDIIFQFPKKYQSGISRMNIAAQ